MRNDKFETALGCAGIAIFAFTIIAGGSILIGGAWVIYKLMAHFGVL